MSKIICDICGTSYPETAKQCPICGCVRPGDVQRVTNEVKADGKVATGYTHVKGGRFTKSNVKRRAQPGAGRSVDKAPERRREEPETQSSRGLVIAAIVLLLAIIGVVIYIAIHFFGPNIGPGDGETQPSSTITSPVDLSCRGITLDAESIELKTVGSSYHLSYTLQPANTTDKDKITFTSENPEIATVDQYGNVTTVAEGTTRIVIQCGEAVAYFTVACKVESAPTVPTVPTVPTTAPTTPSTPATTPTTTAEDIRLNRKDITLMYKGERWELYSGTVAKNLVKFTSENEDVVTFIDGYVTAVGRSSQYVWVHAEYDGVKVSCKILCNFKESTGGTTGSGGVTEDGDNVMNKTGKIVNVQENVNVRSGPGTNYEKAGVLALGAAVTVTEKQTGTDGYIWYKTAAGWVREDFVKFD